MLKNIEKKLFNSSPIELMRQRTSWRSFSGEDFGEDIKKQLLEFIAGLGDAPFGTEVRFHLVNAKPPGRGKVPGTYGMIRGANSFFVSSAKEGPVSLIDCGYLFEKLILFATELGLGTCWMSGTFSRTSFAEKAGLQPGFIIPAICPVGIRAKKRDMTDKITRIVAGSRKRKPWEELFFRDTPGIPLGKSDAGDFATPLEMVRIAPSASNMQPWRIVSDNGCFHLLLKRPKGAIKVSGIDAQRLDMGIAMSHFELAAYETGLDGSWEKIDPDLGPLPNGTEYIASWVT